MWLEEYEKLMFNETNNEELTIKSVQLKNTHMPEYLYKYRSVKPETIDALNNNFLICAAPSLLNDPQENSITAVGGDYLTLIYKFMANYIETQFQESIIEFDTNKLMEKEDCFGFLMDGFKIPYENRDEFREFYESTEKDILKYIDLFREEIRSIGEDIYRICSLSEINNSVLMWSHYADNYEGFCIGYNIQNMNNEICECTLPVIYTDSILRLDKTYFDKSIKSNNSLPLQAICRKCREWDYEKEWRIIQLKNNNDKTQKIYLADPEAIYFGININIDDKDVLIKIASQKKIDCYQMVKNPNNYDIFFSQINIR